MRMGCGRHSLRVWLPDVRNERLRFDREPAVGADSKRRDRCAFKAIPRAVVPHNDPLAGRIHQQVRWRAPLGLRAADLGQLPRRLIDRKRGDRALGTAGLGWWQLVGGIQEALVRMHGDPAGAVGLGGESQGRHRAGGRIEAPGVDALYCRPRCSCTCRHTAAARRPRAVPPPRHCALRGREAECTPPWPETIAGMSSCSCSLIANSSASGWLLCLESVADGLFLQARCRHLAEALAHRRHEAFSLFLRADREPDRGLPREGQLDRPRSMFDLHLNELSLQPRVSELHRAHTIEGDMHCPERSRSHVETTSKSNATRKFSSAVSRKARKRPRCRSAAASRSVDSTCTKNCCVKSWNWPSHRAASRKSTGLRPWYTRKGASVPTPAPCPGG